MRNLSFILWILGWPILFFWNIKHFSSINALGHTGYLVEFIFCIISVLFFIFLWIIIGFLVYEPTPSKEK
jgi:hypothetical protein